MYNELQVDQEEGDAEGSGRYGTIPPFPPPPPGLDGKFMFIFDRITVTGIT